MDELKNHDEFENQLNEEKETPEKKKGNVLTLVLYIISMYILPIVVLSVIAIVVGVSLGMETVQSGVELDQAVLEAQITESIMGYSAIVQFIAYLSILTFILFRYWKVFGEEIRKNEFGSLIKKVVGYGLITFVINLLVGIIMSLFEQGGTLNQEMINMMLTKSFIITTIMVVIMAPIVEEVIFRYIIQNWGIKHGGKFGIALSSILFALVHVGGGFLSIIPYLALGVCFGITYYRTKNLTVAIGVHMFNNLMSVVLPLIFLLFE